MKIILKLIKFIFLSIFFVCFVGVLIAGYSFCIEPHRLSSETVSCEDELVNNSVTIAYFSDTHFGFGYSISDFKKVIDAINSKKPDIILFGGDLIDDFSNFSGDENEIISALSELQCSYGKYAVFGNHDYGGGMEYYYEDIMNKSGFTVLKNSSFYIDELNIKVLGIDDMLIGYGNTSCISQLNENSYNIVLCHEPDIYDQIDTSNTDFMFAGHSHGGQINIPFTKHQFLPVLGSKYVYGLYKKSDNSAYM